jgi:hypothetical protein
MSEAEQDRELKELLRQAKQLAVRYYQLTQKPLGVTGEVAEYEAAQKLGLTLAATPRDLTMTNRFLRRLSLDLGRAE